MEKTVSKCERVAAGLHGTSCSSESQRESERERDPAPGLYSPVIFNHPPLAYYTVSPSDHSGSTFGSFSCSHAARFKQNQRMIALRLSDPLLEKEGGAGGLFDRKRLARANGMTFKELALVLLQFQKTSNICWEKKKSRGTGMG